ncbi:DUF6090 family protein [uncultured Eudoraea sp.]|uniref:DUF6090 family protein n=1 Tax=uncultured Eudoraea sp. TaxID=1035614 RepID=UPI002626B623|nr:DUF6090 family protein [uncultured Eudoraea sp.]
MIGFFRKIRKQLADDNQFFKYSRYAIGEIILVVIGILIALQVNNWNEFQKDREIEKKALLNLVENMELTINKAERKIARIQRHNKSGQIIFAAIKNSDQTIDTLGRHFHWALMNHANLALSKAGYESLKNIGFEIIRNEILKKEIVNLHENTYIELSRMQKWGEEVRPDLDTYLIDHFIRYNNGNWMPRNFNEVAKDHYFYGLINIAEGQRNFYMREYKKMLVETKRVLQLIQDELGEVN